MNNNTTPPVIYYHSVAPSLFESWPLKWLTLELRFFEDQLAFLKNRNYDSIFLYEWLAYRVKNKPLRNKTVCLTFDDGLLDNYVYAFPLAKKYGFRFTIFVSPEFIDPREIVRPTLEDVWAGRCREDELQARGYASWPELRIMQESGVVDIQSHTMSHDKYIASSRIKAFYYGGHLGVYPILNANPALKPTYPADPGFEKRLPTGAPLFEEASAVIVRKHTVNPGFLEEAAAIARRHSLEHPDQRPAYESEVRRLHGQYDRRGELITDIESAEAYRRRLHYEVVTSKQLLEEKLEKEVWFLCWPHGDNNAEAHQLAREAGYLATTSGKMTETADHPDRIPRFGAGKVRNSRWLSRNKFHYKIASHFKQQPFLMLSQANDLKNKYLKKA